MSLISKRSLKIILCFVILSTLNCFTATRTLYQPYGKTGGYSEKSIDNEMMVARFNGNAFTNTQDAANFSIFRAIEICKQKEFRLARMYQTNDLTSSKTVLKSATNTYTSPTSFSATANSNSYGATTNTNVTGGVHGGNKYGNSSSWEETYHYPTFDTVFSCTNQTFRLGFQLKSISADDMKQFVKDFLGAVQIIAVTDESPSKDIVKVGDIVTKINGDRVFSEIQFIKSANKAADKNKILLTLIRDGTTITVVGKSNETTAEDERKANEFILASCKIPELKQRPICLSR